MLFWNRRSTQVFHFNSKQITLNETRDTLRETYKTVCKYSTKLELFSFPAACRIDREWCICHFCLNLFQYVLFVQIIQLEESIVQLKEDLALEREEAVEEKERLQKAVVCPNCVKAQSLAMAASSSNSWLLSDHIARLECTRKSRIFTRKR